MLVVGEPTEREVGKAQESEERNASAWSSLLSSLPLFSRHQISAFLEDALVLNTRVLTCLPIYFWVGVLVCLCGLRKPCRKLAHHITGGIGRLQREGRGRARGEEDNAPDR